MTPTRQELTSGDDATVYQAGRDIHQHGPSMTEMRQIALDVYRANALELRGIAEDIANARAERITNDYLTRLMEENPGASQNLADPDVQSVMFEAQKAYARSGEDDLETVLVDLLADRTSEVERSLRTLVLNEAILSAPKLTEAQRRAVALVFLLRYTRSLASTVDAYMAHYVAGNVIELGVNLPHSQKDIQHLEYVGVASSSLASVDFGSALMAGIEGLFTRGFPVETIPEHLRTLPEFPTMFVPCSRQPENLQLVCRADDDVASWTETLGIPERTEELKNLAKNGRFQPHEVVAEAVAFDPRMEDIAKAWESQELSNVTLTSVGLAIGHSYWKRVTGATTPLSVWL